jgi:hypothetical protein
LSLEGKGALGRGTALGLAPIRLRPRLRDRLAHRAIQLAVAREDLARVEIQLSTVQIGHSAGLGDDQRARRDIPRPQPEFPQRVNPPAGDVAEVSTAEPVCRTPCVRIMKASQKVK